MKKLLLLLIIPALLCGCEKNDSENKVETPKSTKSTTTITTTSSSTTSTTTAKTTKSTKTTIVVSDPTKPTTKTVEKNLYTSSYDNKTHKYSYVYEDYDVCRKKGNVIFLDIADNVNKDVMVYNCEKVTDSNGKEYYGLYFYTDTSDDARFYY